MLRIIKKAKNILFLAGMLLPVSGYAAEITAIDFNGDIIGQVISTGTVINPDGDNIGYITADSLIMSEHGAVIGGVVPQGIAIGMDNRLLGKIHSDGVVRSLSGKTLGKSLPNGLVINDTSNVIGAVLYPGIIYSPNGEAIGRLTGGGEYTKLEGQHIGFVSANGYAYRKSGEDYILDGKLMSSKMVVSVDGKFIGSVAPTGQIIDFEGKSVGKIHANGYAYDAQGKVIGSVISTGYAFTQAGKYLGIVGYNGEVKDGDKVIARYRADGKLVKDSGEVIGFAVDIAATANDNVGKYLGYLAPNGNILRGGKVVGQIGAKGYVYDKDGKKIGDLVKTGPIYDSMARLKGQSMKNGRVISLGGGNIGQMSGKWAYSTNGTLLGGTVDSMIAVENSGPVGISNIDAGVVVGGSDIHVSPFGYVINADGKPVGTGYSLSAVYGPEGVLYSYIDPNGMLYRAAGGTHLSGAGIVQEGKNFVGEILNPRYALDYEGKPLGTFADSNLLLDQSGNIMYKVIPGGYVVETKDKLSPLTSPIKGFSGNKLIALNTGGDLIGYADSEGNVIGTNGDISGHVVYNEYVTDNNGIVNGKLVPFATVVNDKCNIIGVVDGKGDVIDHHDVISGHILPNGQAISDVGNYIGYTVQHRGLIDFDGNFSGTVSGATGRDANGKNIGCVDRRGIITDEEHHQRYGVILPEPVIDFENRIFGHVLATGKVINSDDATVGYMQPDGNVVSSSKKNLGNVMRYKVAYKNNNTFLGMIDGAGQVRNSKGKVVGQVNFDGSVEHEGVNVGYALYDFYVYDDNFVVYGYLTKDGTVLSMVGSQLGKLDRGFVIRRGEVVARGNRDYIVRDSSYNVIGELLLNDTVVNAEGANIGYLKENGAIHDSDGNEIAQATQYQYYIATNKPEPIETKPRRPKYRVTSEESTQPEPESEPDSGITIKRPSGSNRNKIVGFYIDPDGKYGGDVYDNGEVIDKDGRVLGYKQGDLITDTNHNIIGTFEVNIPQVFIPKTPNAYDTQDDPIIGPDDRGPGGRLSPERAAMLADYQNERRKLMYSGLQSELPLPKKEYQESSFTGYEEDGWGGGPTGNQISSWRVDMSEMILEDKGIPAVLARSVYASDGLGEKIPVTAIVERNVFAEEGRNIIIPAGSRVIGSLDDKTDDLAGDSGGAIKINITWKRLIRPDGSQWTFNSAQTADAQGRAGAIGYLDEQLLKRYTFPVVSTALQGMVNVLMAAGDGSTSTTNSNGTTTTQDARSEAMSDARRQVNDKISEIIKDIMKRKSAIKSVAYVPAGTRIIIYPNQDLWLNSVERSRRNGGSGGGENHDRAEVLSNGHAGEDGNVEVTYDGSNQGNYRPVSAPQPSNGGLTSQPTPSYNPGNYPTQPPPAIDSSSSSDVPELIPGDENMF